MKKDKNVFNKNTTNKKIDKINKLINDIDETNKTIDHINKTLILCNGEVVDKKNFSIMSLPTTKEIMKDL